jgi:hypothetical protein
MDGIGAILDFLADRLRQGHGGARARTLRVLPAAAAFGLPAALAAAVLPRFGAAEPVVTCVLLPSPAFVWTRRLQQCFDRNFY